MYTDIKDIWTEKKEFLTNQIQKFGYNLYPKQAKKFRYLKS
jgi:hypothetical protein